LDALIQSAVCEDIGWREGTRKMIVYASDAGFHSQGNGLRSFRHFELIRQSVSEFENTKP